MRQVDIPALASLPGINYNGGADASHPVVPEKKCQQKNVYNLLRDAAMSPPQQLLDFGQLLDASACDRDALDSDGGSSAATDFVVLDRDCLRRLHCHNYHSMNLFEIVAVLHARITKEASCIGGDGDYAPASAFVEGGGGELNLESVRQTLLAQSAFSRRFLAVATGSTTGTAPALPPYSKPVFEQLDGNYDVGSDAVANLCFAYAELR
eukprot:g14265.t1